MYCLLYSLYIFHIQCVLHLFIYSCICFVPISICFWLINNQSITKILIFIYNNAQIHPNVTVQYLKSIPFVQKACKTCVHTSVPGKNQSSSQTKGFMHDSVQKILDTCERVANIFLHRGANYTYMYNLHTVCKSAHVNGALVCWNAAAARALFGHRKWK